MKPPRPPLGAWEHSSHVPGGLLEAVTKHKTEHDVIVAGSASVVHALAEEDLVDEYRILVFPDLVGHGTKLFPAATAPTHLHLISAEGAGPAVLICYKREPF